MPDSSGNFEASAWLASLEPRNRGFVRDVTHNSLKASDSTSIETECVSLTTGRRRKESAVPAVLDLELDASLETNARAGEHGDDFGRPMAVKKRRSTRQRSTSLCM